MAETPISQSSFYGQPLERLKAYKESLWRNLEANTTSVEYGIGDKNLRRAGSPETLALLAAVQAEIDRQESILLGGADTNGIVTFAGFGGITH